MQSMLCKRQRRQVVPELEKGVVVGIDVGKDYLHFRACRPEQVSRLYCVEHNRAGFTQLEQFLQELTAQGYEVWTGWEPTGPYSFCLKEFLYARPYRRAQVNSYHVKRTKEVRDNTPHKTDSKDPRVIADLIWQGCYQQVPQLGPVHAELRTACADWKATNRDRTALRNSFQALLAEWCPELRRWFRDPLCRTAQAVVRRYGSAPALGQADLRALRALIRTASGGRLRPELAQVIRQGARESIAPTAGQRMRHLHLCRLLDQLELLERHQRTLRRELEALLEQVPEAALLLSVPGLGTITVACLLGECGQLGDFPTCGQLEKFIGLNLYEISSGQRVGQRRISKRGRSLARQALCQAAVGQMRQAGLYHAYCQRQRQKRQPAGKIRVAIARKLLRLVYSLVRAGNHFDAARFFAESRAQDGLVILQGASLAA